VSCCCVFSVVVGQQQQYNVIIISLATASSFVRYWGVKHEVAHIPAGGCI
jgi:hypothetical protein